MSVSAVESLIEQQLSLYGLISRAVENLRKVGATNVTQHRIRGRLAALCANWEKFQANHVKLISQKRELQQEVRAQAEALPYFTDDRYAICEERFLDAQEIMAISLDEKLAESHTDGASLSNASAPPSMHSSQGARLPRIDLPQFSGDYGDWVQFRDLFTSLVGSSTSLTCVEKLQYLKSSLSGAAAQRIKNVALTAGNFQRTWDDLEAHYDNKRVLVDAALHALFNAKPVTRESSVEIEQLHSEVVQAVGSLEALGRKTDHWDDFLVYSVVHKLDAASVKEWERELGASTNPPSWGTLQNFLTSRARSLQAFERATGAQTQVQTQAQTQAQLRSGTASKSRPKPARSHHVSGKSRSGPTCDLCAAPHYLSTCPAYLAKSPAERHDVIAQKQLCFNCLGSHRIKSCRSQKRCQVCGGHHHTSIHEPGPGPIGAPSIGRSNPVASSVEGRNQSIPPSATASVNAVSSHVAQIAIAERPPVLLATALVRVISKGGTPYEARALLDQGSEISLVSESLAQRLRLPRARSSMPIIGIGAENPRASHGSVSIDVHSRSHPAFSCEVSASILPKLTGYLPSTAVAACHWPHLRGLDLADPHFAEPRRIDLVLGADVYGLILKEGIRKGPMTAPIAQHTTLGWIVSGPASASALRSGRPSGHSFQCSPDTELHDLVQQFFAREEASLTPPDQPSPEEVHCDRHYEATHTRDPEGRYLVRLPFSRSTEDLGESYTPAVRSLARMEKRFVVNPALQAAYAGFLKEYEDLGHMTATTEFPSRDHGVFYLPHHCVMRQTSSTTKYRVVFNGSQPTNRGLSLNDCLHEGPKLLTDLANVITRWRTYSFVFSADVEKMYRQVQIHPEDRDFQRILWRDSPDAPVTEYRLNTVTYGLACAPFLAIRTLHQLANDEGSRFPRAKGVIEENTYVDDVLAGAHSLEDGRAKIADILGLFNSGCFPLKKWIANCDDLLDQIPADAREPSPSLSFDDGPSHRTLGLTWRPHTDSFVFAITDDGEPRVVNKRTVLSRTAQLFDPLGWLAPVIIRAKIFIQELWDADLGWDDPLPPDLAERWKDYVRQLKNVELISVPRWIGLSPSAIGVEVHGFSDASHAALGAVVYVRVLNDVDNVRVTLVTAKSKVAPRAKSSAGSKRSRVIRVTTPRLELAAALLLAQLISRVRRVLKLDDAPVHLWTDSTTALYWIQGHPSRWKDFVRNRVAKIQEVLPDARWHHVVGEDNPADCASRGITPTQLAEHRLWWQGPSWLVQHSTSWPSETPLLDDDHDLEERQQIVALATTGEIAPIWELIDRYSSLTRLLRITAWCRRFVELVRDPTKRAASIVALTPEELDSARHFWISATQQAFFSTELTLLRQGRLPRSHALIRLTPRVGADGLLRVGGRLTNARLDPDSTHPIVLPRDSAFTQLVLHHVHRETLHGGAQVMLATLRRTYWIIGGRSPVRSFILRCVPCARQRANTASQLTGQLPASRSLPARPFAHSGVDYAGPFTLKTRTGRAARTYKGYLIVFVCFSTSAVHLEASTDYTTEGFLAAFKRFTGRRGIPARLSSDCGTNLVGADAELRRLFDASSRELKHLANLLANDGTKWEFNPPSAPHFGGKWEAAVKSVKFHLKRVIGETSFTYEEFSTLLVQIEAVLNSRPLCPLSDDPADIDALTPGHFLIGAALNSVPEPSLIALPANRLSRWQLLRQYVERFWERWSTEYLQRFLAVTKWQHPQENLKVGALVLVADERYPPAKWPLARVTAVHPGADGLVRVATVRTQTSTLKRPIVKLCPLPVRT